MPLGDSPIGHIGTADVIMRRFAIAIAALVLAAPTGLFARSEAPTSAPDAHARIAPLLANLFSQPHQQQQEIRQQLEGEPNLPLVLAAMLNDPNPVVRRTSLALLCDRYGDWSVVSAVQSVLNAELARGAKADGYVIAACCEILTDWPQWDSIPVLVNAMKSRQQVADHGLAGKVSTTLKTSVWRQVDAALRLISGEWPMPEPDATAPVIAANSPQDACDREQLQKSWDAWWSASCSSSEPLPQVRLQLTWTAPPMRQSSSQLTTVTAAMSLLWIRPTGSIHYSRVLGVAPLADEPAWKWDEKSHRQAEYHLNAIQADSVRGLFGDVSSAAPATAWSISRPAGLPENWHGKLQVISPFGPSAAVDLVENGTPGSVRPPASAGAALTELMSIPTQP
jgi:hypothetical protein